MSTFNDLKKQYIDLTMAKIQSDMMALEGWIKKGDDTCVSMPVSIETNTIHDKLDAIFNRIQLIEEGMNDIRSRVDAIEHRCTWDNYVIPGGQTDIIECDFFDPTYSPRRNPKLPSDTLSTISHESSVIDFGVQDKTNDIIEIHKQEQPIIAAAPSIVNDSDVEGDADEHEIIIEEEKVSVGEAIEEEEEVEEEEEEVEEEDEEEDELEEVTYKNKTYYKDSENNVYRLNKDGEIDDTPIGRWNEKTQSVRFTVVA
jgi:hypothetical protein